LEGSGDPYFVALRSGEVVRIPHDAISGDALNLEAVERVAPSIEELVGRAEVTAAQGLMKRA
jgi:hypothetical protein